jgi:hypothetical protein
MRPWLSSSIAIALLLSSFRAWANPSARLVYVRGAGADRCPNEEAVRTAVSTRLGYDPFFLTAPTTIFVEVARDGDRFVARLKLIDSQGVERGTRHLETHTGYCADLIGTLALTISLVIDPVSLAAPPVVSGSAPAPSAAPATDPVPTTGPTPVTESRPATAPAPEPEPTPAPSPPSMETPSGRRKAMTVFAGLSALATLGSALAPTAGATAFVGVRADWLSVRIEGRADLPASVPDPPARSSAVFGAALPCVHWWAAFACGSVGFEWIHASGEATYPRNPQTLVGVLGGRLGAEIEVADRFALAPFAELLAPLQRPRIQNGAVIEHPFSVIAGDVGASGLVRF